MLVLLLLPAAVMGQGNRTDSIDLQVWIPFMQTYDAYDTDGFLALHHPDVMRVLQDQGDILRYDEYRSSLEAAKERDASQQLTRKLDLHFTERTLQGDRAFEVGYYKVTITNNSGVNRNFYGLFHVVLVRDQGKWLIWMNADTSSGADASKFDAATPVSGKN